MCHSAGKKSLRHSLEVCIQQNIYIYIYQRFLPNKWNSQKIYLWGIITRIRELKKGKLSNKNWYYCISTEATRLFFCLSQLTRTGPISLGSMVYRRQPCLSFIIFSGLHQPHAGLLPTNQNSTHYLNFGL